MTIEMALVFLIIVIAIGLFLSEKLRPDVIAMLVMISLILTQLITFEQAFASFANPAVITVGAVLVISYGLFQTGMADFLGGRILQISGTNQSLLIVSLMLTVGIMSAFMNNIGATAVLLPAVMGICKQTDIPPSKLLIPLSFASLMGGNLTLIGTPPNILASAALGKYVGIEFGFFDFLPMGVVILSSGILYMATIGHHLLPHRGLANLAKTYYKREYLSEVHVLPQSPLAGQNIIESRFGHDFDLTIVGITRDCELRLGIHPEESIMPNDTLLVKGSLDQIFKLKKQRNLYLEFGDNNNSLPHKLTSPDVTIAEVSISDATNLDGKSIRDIRFRQKYGLTVLALQHRTTIIENRIADEPLRQGDILLVQGKRENLNLLRMTPEFLLLEPVSLEERRTEKAPIALAILAGLLITVTTGWLHISVAGVAGVILMVLLKVLHIEEVYQAIDWRAIFFIAGMISLGTAMEVTHTAEFLADVIVEKVSQFGPIGLLLGMYFLTALFTQLMSNSAATVLVSPIAINIALQIEADPRPFLMVVVIAASTIFLTPIGHAANILVYGPGRYKFTDYTKVGLGLMLLHVMLTVLLLPIIWPLYP